MLKLEKVETDLCRCCHAEGDFKSLFAPYYLLAKVGKEKVVYSEMLQECFNLELVPASEPLNHLICGICNFCIQKLYDALLFKRQVQKCEKQFRDVYMEHICKASAICELPVKEEMIDFADCNEEKVSVECLNSVIKDDFDSSKLSDDERMTDDDDGRMAIDGLNSNRGAGTGWKLNDEDINEEKVNVCCLNGVIKDDFDNSKLCDDGRVADDGDNGRMVDDDDVNSDKGADCILNDEEYRAPPQRKRGPYKKKKGATSKVKKKNKPRTKTVALPKAKDIESTNTGVSKVVQRRFPIKKDVDYKQIGDMYQCGKCDKKSKNHQSMRDHIAKIHLKIPKYSCPECPKKFLTIIPFNKHKLDEHNIDDRYKCNACESLFHRQGQLKKHFNSFHMLGVQYKCDVCDYICFSAAALKKHKFKHRTVKEFQCKHCEKSFKRKSNLKLHERIHTGDRRKVCNVCGQAFVQKASLNYHMAKYHPGEKF